MLFADIQQFNSDILRKSVRCTTNHVPRHSDSTFWNSGVHDRIKLFTDFLIQIVDMKIQQALVELDHVLA